MLIITSSAIFGNDTLQDMEISIKFRSLDDKMLSDEKFEQELIEGLERVKNQVLKYRSLAIGISEPNSKVSPQS